MSVSSMAVSRFESLSDDLLVHLFEYYIDAVDIAVAFLGQQNKRLNYLVSRCRITKFNFLECRKAKFFHSVHYLPKYERYIQTLLLGDGRTPGQVEAFCKIYPTFASFPNLRYLYLSMNSDTAECVNTEFILSSLSKTTLETLVFEVTDSSQPKVSNQWLLDALQIPTLKRLRIKVNALTRFQLPLIRIKANIRSLKLSGFSIDSSQLFPLLHLMPHLRSLDINLAYKQEKSIILLPCLSSIDSLPANISLLHTLHLFVTSPDNSFCTLLSNLHQLTNLRYFIVYGPLEILNCIDWIQLVHTSLSHLIRTEIRAMVSMPIDETQINRFLQLFESIDRVERDNLRVIIEQHHPVNDPAKSQLQHRFYHRQDFEQPLLRYWIAPQRDQFESHSLDHIERLVLSNYWTNASSRFNNVKYLIIIHLNKDLFSWFKTHVNHGIIHSIDLTCFKDDFFHVSSLFGILNNLRSVRMTYGQLMGSKNDRIIPRLSIRYVDLSADDHPFEHADLKVIAHLFPHLEHLKINPHDPQCFPMLLHYWPRLRSLTYRFGSNDGHVRLQQYSTTDRSWSMRYETLKDFNTLWIDLVTFYRNIQ